MPGPRGGGGHYRRDYLAEAILRHEAEDRRRAAVRREQDSTAVIQPAEHVSASWHAAGWCCAADHDYDYAPDGRERGA